MATLSKPRQTRFFTRTILLSACAVVLTPALAWETPSNLREKHDQLRWDSDAPSYNIYENGEYIATVHDSQSFGPLFNNSVYQVVAHDSGNDFTSLSEPFLYRNDDGRDNDEELQFADFQLYIEVNNTDGDIGIHSKVDGEVWNKLEFEDSNGRKLIDIKLFNGMAKQGITELFFESAEPTFDELDPVAFFNRFPAGEYEVEGVTLDGREVEGETTLSHVIPAAPVIYVGDNPANPNEGCDDVDSNNPAASVDLNGNLPIAWDPVLNSHPSLGKAGPVVVDSYILAVETEDIEVAATLDAETTRFIVPAELVNVGEVVKVEVLVKDDTDNQVGTEACVLLM